MFHTKAYIHLQIQVIELHEENKSLRASSLLLNLATVTSRSICVNGSLQAISGSVNIRSTNAAPTSDNFPKSVHHLDLVCTINYEA